METDLIEQHLVSRMKGKASGQTASAPSINFILIGIQDNLFFFMVEY